MGLLDKLVEVYEGFKRDMEACTTATQVQAVRSDYVGRQGKVRDLFKFLSEMSEDQRRDAGLRINQLKSTIERDLAEKEKTLTQTQPAVGRREFFDVTVQGRRPRPGRRHPVYQTMEEIVAVLSRFGFEVASGPEIETDYNNFEALNMPRGHPSRDPWDSFFLSKEHLLRSHTSPVQIRTMKRRKPPLRIIAPGRVYRPDTVDASHLPMFHQVEGLMVGEAVTFVHLKSVLSLFARAMFGTGVRTRFRPSYFPFTEPSAEMEISCVVCGAKGCPACKGTGWLEILGAGMVHPKVFLNVGYNPEEVSGFAFGMGVERIAMMRYGVGDIRLFVENRTAFLEQF